MNPYCKVIKTYKRTSVKAPMYFGHDSSSETTAQLYVIDVKSCTQHPVNTVLHLGEVKVPPGLQTDSVGSDKGGGWHLLEQEGSFRPPQPSTALGCLHQRASLSQLGLKELLQ